MRFNNSLYLIKEGFKSIFLHGFMSFAAICVTVACLLIMGVFSALLYNVTIMVDDLNETNEIMVYIDENLTESEAKSIQTQISTTIDNIMEATFRSREEALQDFIADHDGDAAFSGVEADTFRHRVVVTLEDNARMEETIQEIKKINGVADITAYYELAEGFSTMQNILRIISIAVILVLLAISLLIISNTIKMAMADRREEIFIMKMVGATNGFIRLPFIVEGMFLGMSSEALAFVLNRTVYNTLAEKMDEMDSLNIIELVPFNELLGPMVITFVLAGLFVSIIGSWTSIRKFLDV